MVKPRDWILVRLLRSAGSSPKTSRSRVGLLANAGKSPLSLSFLLALLVRLSSLLLLLLLPLMPPNPAFPGVIDGVGGLPSASPRPRLQVLRLAPHALEVAPGATHPPCCRGQTRCPSLTSFFYLDLTASPRSCPPHSRPPPLWIPPLRQ